MTQSSKETPKPSEQSTPTHTIPPTMLQAPPSPQTILAPTASTPSYPAYLPPPMPFIPCYTPTYHTPFHYTPQTISPTVSTSSIPTESHSHIPSQPQDISYNPFRIFLRQSNTLRQSPIVALKQLCTSIRTVISVLYDNFFLLILLCIFEIAIPNSTISLIQQVADSHPILRPVISFAVCTVFLEICYAIFKIRPSHQRQQ